MARTPADGSRPGSRRVSGRAPRRRGGRRPGPSGTGGPGALRLVGLAALVIGLGLLVLGAVRAYAGVEVGGPDRGTPTDRVAAPFTELVFGGLVAVVGGAVLTSVRTERRRRDETPPRGRGGLPLA